MPVGEKTKVFNGIFTLSETAAFLIQQFENGADAKAASAMLAKQFEIDSETAAQDTDDFIQQLLHYGILTD